MRFYEFGNSGNCLRISVLQLHQDVLYSEFGRAPDRMHLLWLVGGVKVLVMTQGRKADH
jgi:hypothetical protein